jgi:hypothetical protein
LGCALGSLKLGYLSANVFTDSDQILVTNGIYKIGGRVVYGSLTNRVVINKAVTVQSVNGPGVTAIQGYQVPSSTNGDSAVRCVYLTNNAMLVGFMITNGATRTSGDIFQEQIGGGAWCESSSAIVSNCVISGNAAGDSGGGAFGGTLKLCVLAGNSVPSVGGGAYNSMLNDCTITGNYAGWGGGGSGAFWWDPSSITLNHCTLSGNLSANVGGGAYGGVLNLCVLSSNLVVKITGDGASGGADSSELDGCLLSGNQADYGGGAQSCNLQNCVVTNNYATWDGGGVRSCYDVNCTIIDNTAGRTGGGADSSELDNCIIYFNATLSNANYSLDTCSFNYSCTTPFPDNGTGNFADDPFFADSAGGDLHLQSNSPCVNAGRNSYVTHANDFDGKPRIIGLVVDVGAYEFPTPVAIAASYTNVTIGFTVNFTSQIYAGTVSSFFIDFGDGTTVSNQLSAAHSWAVPGDRLVTLTAFSDLYPGGVSGTCIVHVDAGIYYVSLGNTNPVPPYASWDTAATNIQDAIDAILQPTATVMVTNGIYSTGGRVMYGSMTNRVVVSKTITLKSVNGPGATAIQGNSPIGDSAVRCVYLTNGASLIGFTLSNGATRKTGDYNHEEDGGGVWCESNNSVISNCIFTANSAWDAGGGIARGTLINCLLTNNSSFNVGGGTFASTLNNCTLSGNFADYNGGGIYGDTWRNPSTLNNCILNNNHSAYVGGGAYGGTLNYCIISNNVATDDYYGDGYGVGGGVDDATLNNCVITGNHATGENAYGDGADSCNIYNSVVFNNYSESEALS